MSKAATATIQPPPGLARAFARAGFVLQLHVTRAEAMDLANDPDATPPLLEAPIEEQEARNLAAMAAVHEKEEAQAGSGKG